MKTSMKIFIAVTVFVILGLIAAVIALGVGMHGLRMKADESARRVDYMYETALCESLDTVTETENNLAKMLVSVGEEENISLASDIRVSAGSAAARVATLPVDVYSYSGLEKFLNQVSDFMSGYIRAVEAGEDPEKYADQFESLYKTVSAVRKKLEEATGKLGGEYSIASDVDETGSFNIGEGDFNVEYPGIIYDGPFSDSRDTSWKGLKGLPEVSEEEAAKELADRTGMQGRSCGRSAGDAEMYLFEGSCDGCEAYASVTVYGGKIAVLSMCREPGEGSIGQIKAQDKALDYALRAGYSDTLTPVWYNEADGYIIVTLAPEIRETVYYTDLVKIKLRASDGALAGMEAYSYCANHRKRDLPVSLMDKDAVRSCVSPKLSVEHVRLALIPKGSGEKLCYEVSSEYNGLDYFVYIDAVTGKQVDILRILDGEVI